MISIREDFVKHFGEQNAQAFENAAEEHENGLHPNKGSDPFKWVLMLVISYECGSKSDFAEYHKIACDWKEVTEWIRESADFGSYDGDIDALALFSGSYLPYVKEIAN